MDLQKERVDSQLHEKVRTDKMKDKGSSLGKFNPDVVHYLVN